MKCGTHFHSERWAFRLIELAMNRAFVLVAATVGALVLTLALLALLRPWLLRHVLARPNARSSHRVPTPQGGGLAVVAAWLLVIWGASAWTPGLLENQSGRLLALSTAAVLLAIIGAVDDIRPLPQLLRLAVQCLAVGTVLAALPDDFQLVPQIPRWAERVCLLLGGVWMVNLTNFMDGIDWMTVTQFVPVTGAIVLLGLLDGTDWLSALVAAALLGAVLGFAPFNKPVARLFLGDVGSLPLGLLLGWLLLQLAGRGHVAAAIILPLYYIGDATITLVRRVARGEPVWQAHRQHFYQRAVDNQFTVPQVLTRVFLVNMVLGSLALLSTQTHDLRVKILLVAAGVAVVVWLLFAFARRGPEIRRQSVSG
jgi:UDP-N-acetylmuramyl pentapeptide phosphotransferase/UDP-N-acetylglucosamine-1-phosphate transferase